MNLIAPGCLAHRKHKTSYCIPQVTAFGGGLRLSLQSDSTSSNFMSTVVMLSGHQIILICLIMNTLLSAEKTKLNY